MFRVLFAVVLSGLLACAPALAEEDPEPPATLEELQAQIAKLVEDNDLPAVGIALVDRSGPLWVGAFGKADIENDVDADADSMFRIGSTSKMFVALSVLKLVEEGRLSLDAKLVDIAPEIEFENPWADSAPVRLVHLLEHTTGWDDIHLPEYGHNDPRPASLKEGLDFHPHSRVSRWQPGTRMSYCNAGPPVAAYVVQKVTGQDFEDYVAQNFFRPMGMRTMTYRLNEDVREKGVTLYANGNEPQDYWHIVMRPSGSINASPNDMARLVGFFVNRGAVNGRRLVSQRSIARMEKTGSTTAARAGQQIGYGLANYSSIYETWEYRGHDGGVNGGVTELAYLREAGVGHVIMANSDDFATFRQISDLVRAYETRDLEPEPIAGGVELTAEHATIEGLYQPINSRQQLSYFIDRVFGIQKFWIERDQVVREPLLGGEAVNYYPASRDLFRHAETGRTALSRVVDPLAGPVVHVGTLVAKPVPPELVYGQLAIAALWAFMILTSVLYAIIWGIRKWRGKIPAGPTMRIRVWPLLASVSIIAFMGLFLIAMSDPFTRLAAPTFFSVSIMLLTVAFAVFAVLGARTAVVERHTHMNRLNYWHSTLASFTHLLVALYFAWFGIIGLMTWT